MSDIDLAILQAERDVQVNAPAKVGALGVFAGNDFLTGTGPITARDILIIDALRNVNFTSSQFPYGTNTGHTVLLRAGNLMNIDSTGDKSVFANASSVDVVWRDDQPDRPGAGSDYFRRDRASPVLGRQRRHSGGGRSDLLHSGESPDAALERRDPDP